MNNNFKRSSTSYVFTADVNCANDMQRISELQKAIAIANKIDANFGGRAKRVCLKPRLGKNNPAAVDYRHGGKRFHRTLTPYQSILVKDAVRFDVYVYTR